jgi:hypothetical protein
MRTSLRVAIIVLCAFGTAPGCGGDTSGGKSTPQAECEQFASQMRGCGLLSNGDTRCDTADTSGCLERCLLRSNCTELEQFFCEGRPTGALRTCGEDCERSAPTFTCSDGEKIPEEWKCDGDRDCSDGIDEQGCPASPNFACRDGVEIPLAWECDGVDHCTDGSDEVGCPAGTTFTCGDGEEIPQSWKCDGDDDCADRSDEAGCPTRAELTCGASASGG